MKKMLSLMIVLALCISLCACGAEEEKPRLFKNVPDDYSVQLPVYVLTEQTNSATTDTEYYTDVVVDEAGNVVSWNHYRNVPEYMGMSKIESYSMEYNSDGAPVKFVYDKRNGFEMTLEYDDNGFLISTMKLDKEDEGDYESSVFEVDEYGMPVKLTAEKAVTQYDGSLKKETTKYVYINHRDEHGRITRIEKGDATGYKYIQEPIYDDSGRIVKDYTEYNRLVGVKKEVYEDIYSYNMYGFPVECKRKGVEGASMEWTYGATYTIGGYVTVNSADDEVLAPVADWSLFEGSTTIPTPDSVLKGLTAEQVGGSVFRYKLPVETEGVDRYTYILDAIQGTGVGESTQLKAYTVQSGANEMLWRYSGVLTQLLGMEQEQLDDKLVHTGAAGESVELELKHENGFYYLIVTLS